MAFRDALEQAGLAAVQETSTSLVSTYLRFDPLALDHATMRETLVALLKGRNWFDASLPRGRKLWRVPTVYGGAVGLEVIALGEASVLIEMVVNGSVDSNEFMQGSHAPEADHCPFSSSDFSSKHRAKPVPPETD